MARTLRDPWAGRLLGVSLYLKLVVAATLLIGGAAAAGVLVAHAPPDAAPKGWLALGVLGVAGLNALLVHLALRPLRGVAAVVRQVEDGDLSVRVPVSALADHEMARVVVTLNRMLDGLEANRDRERQLAARVAQAEEEERRRLAGHLLDGTAQRLSTVLVRLQLARRAGDCGPHIESAREELLLALTEIGGVARGLRPPELDELGPSRALEVQGRKLTQGSGIRMETEGERVDAHLDPVASLALYRIMQEGIANAVSHGGPSRIRLRYALAPGEVLAELEDDGAGFDPALAAVEPGEHLGLLRMHERARHAGGSLQVEAAPGEGTRLRLTLPRRDVADGRPGVEPSIPPAADT